MMTCDDQLQRWLHGESVHNPDRNECCPDFSCCEPDLQWPRELREKFYYNPHMRMQMLGMALTALLQEKGIGDESFVITEEDILTTQ